jgi:uncharacterized membrane protein
MLLAMTAVTLVLAAALKANCLSDWSPGHQPRGCYNDIQTLWHLREMDRHRLPYQVIPTTIHQDGQLTEVRLAAGQIEYPVLTGLFAWLTSLPATDHTRYLLLSALALAPFAFVTTALLHRLAGHRAVLFAASPLLAAYAFLNWDLLPVAATAAALWTWRRGSPPATGLLLGLGASAKIWPGFVLVPLLVFLLLERRYRDAARTTGAAVVATLAVNLPFLLTSPLGWAAPYLAQSVRRNDRSTNSFWYLIASPTSFDLVNVGSTVTVLLGWLAVGIAGYRLRHRFGGYPWVNVAAAMVSSYIVLGRVGSPQYGLWLLPFLVVVAVPRGWLVAFLLTDLWLWLQWSWLWAWPNWIQGAAMVLRALVLIGLTVVFLQSPERSGQPAGEHPDQHPGGDQRRDVAAPVEHQVLRG